MDTILNHDGRDYHASARVAETLQTLQTLRKGGFASVTGYTPDAKKYEEGKVPVLNIRFISRFSTRNLYSRKVDALKSLSFESITIKGDKVAALTTEDQKTLFRSCVDAMVASMTTEDRTDAHRIAHDTFYIRVCEGVKVHLKTTKVGKETVLVHAEDGLPIAQSVMVATIETGRTEVTAGEKKKVNSGAKVQMDKCIERTLNRKSVGLAYLSLKEDNFETLRMDGEVFTPESIMERVRGSVTMDRTDLENILSVEEDVKV